MTSIQFWLSLLPVIGVLNFCVCSYVDTNDLNKVPRGNYQNTTSYYNSEESETDVVNELNEMLSENDLITEPPEDESTSKPNSKSTFSLLGSRTVIPDQSQLDQVDEDSLKNGHRLVKVNESDEVITETVEDDDESPGAQPLIITETTDYEPAENNTEKPKLSTQDTQVTMDNEQKVPTSLMNDVVPKPNTQVTSSANLDNEQKVPASLMNDVVPKPNTQVTSSANLDNEQKVPASLMNDVVPKPNTQVTSSTNLDKEEKVPASLMNDVVRKPNTQVTSSTNLNKEQKVPASLMNDVVPKTGPAQSSTPDLNVTSSSPVASGTDLYSVDEPTSNQTDDLSSVDNQVTTSFPQELVPPTGSVVKATDLSQNDPNTLKEKLDKKLDHVVKVGQQNNGPTKVDELNANTTSALPDVAPPGSSTQGTLGTSTIAPVTNTVVEPTVTSGENRYGGEQRLERKLDAIQKASTEHGMSTTITPPMAPATPSVDMVIGTASWNDSHSHVSDTKNSESDATLSQLNENVTETSTVGAQSASQGSLAVEGKAGDASDEENAMESYGLSENTGNPSSNKLSPAFRRTHIQHNPLSKTALINSTSARTKTNQRLRIFLKKVIQMFKPPETADDIMGWEAWSPCSRTCGKQAFQTRLRTCGRLVERDFDVVCPEPRVQTQRCKEISCSDLSRKEKLKEFLQLSEQGNAKSKQFPKVEDDQKMIDQMFGNNLDRPRVFLGGNALGKGEESDGGGAERSNENTSDDESEEPVLGDDNAGSEDWKGRYLYTVWGSWSACTRTCGQRTYAFRKRYCINGVSGEIKHHCQKPTILAKKCDVNPCPVNGGLSPWTKWSSCSDSCGIMERHRSCSKPKPAYGGEGCHRLPVQMRMCGSCKDEKVAVARKLSSYSPKVLCGFDPCQKVGCLENKGAICVTDFECNPTFFDDHGMVLRGCKDVTNLFLRPLAQKRCAFDPCTFTKCDIKETKCLVDTKCRPFFVDSAGKRTMCKGSNVLHISSEVMCGFNPCEISTCTVDPDAKCVTDYRCKPMFVNSAGKRISGCTEDEAEEAISDSQKAPNDEQGETDPTTRDGQPSTTEENLFEELQGTVQRYRDEQSVKKSIEGRIGKSKHELDAIKFLENMLQRRISGNVTNPESTKHLHKTSKKKMKLRSRDYLKKQTKNYSQVDSKKGGKVGRLSVKENNRQSKTARTHSGKNIVMSTVHRNDSRTTEIVEQQAPVASRPKKPRVKENSQRPQKTKPLDKASRSGSFKFVETPLDSELWTDNDWKTLEQEQDTDLKDVYKFIANAFTKEKEKQEKTSTPELVSAGGYPGGEKPAPFSSGGVVSSESNVNGNSSQLSVPTHPRNESVNTMVHYKLDVPHVNFKHSRNKGGRTSLKTHAPSPKHRYSGDVKTDDPYVYPWENYLADMADDNGKPVFIDEPVDGVASGESAEQPEYNDRDNTFNDSNFGVYSDSKMLKNETSVVNDVKERQKSSGKTDKERKQKGLGSKSSSDVNLQIPLYDTNSASSALSNVESQNFQDIPSNVETKEMSKPAEATKNPQRAGDSGNTISSSEKTPVIPASHGSEHGQSKLNGETGVPVRVPPHALDEKPLSQHLAVNTTDQRHNSFNEMLLKVVEDEVLKLKAKGMLGGDKNKDWDTEGSEGLSEKEGGQEGNSPSEPILDDSEQEKADVASLKEIDDFLKHDNLGLGDIGGKEESTSPEGDVKDVEGKEESTSLEGDVKDVEGKEESTSPEVDVKDSEVFDEGEGTVESANDYKVSLVPTNDEDTETEEENGMREDSRGSDVQHGKVREPEFKESYSPALSDEIKELGLDEYYVKDGFEEPAPTQDNVEDQKLRDILRVDTESPRYSKNKPRLSKEKPRFSELKKEVEGDLERTRYTAPAIFRKNGGKFRMGKRPLITPVAHTYFRKHNTDGDVIERMPSDYREDDGVERSQTESFVDSDHLAEEGDGQNDGTKGGDMLATYLDNDGKYSGRLDGALLSGEAKARHLDRANKKENFVNALVFNAKDDSVVSQSASEDPKNEEMVSSKNHVTHKGDSLDDDELKKTGLITLLASGHRRKGISKDKKSRIKTKRKKSKRDGVKRNY